MPTPEQDRLDALARSVEELLQRQALVETRLTRLEANLGRSPLETPVAQPARSGLETQVGLTVLNRVGVITLVLGVVFFFKWAADNNWIGPLTRVLLGVFGSFAALFAAEILWRKRQQNFAQGLTGAGIAILYVSLYSAYGFYQLILLWFAYLLLVLVTLAALALSIRYNSAVVNAFGFVMAYVTPWLLSSASEQKFAGISAAFLLVFAWNAWRTSVAPQTFSLQRALLVAANGLVYFGLSCALSGSLHNYLFPIAVVVASLYSMVAARSFRRAAGQLAWVEYFTAHVVLLWGLGIEVIRWTESSTSPENLLSVQTVALSILLAIYAVVLISVGVWTRTARNRIAGLILIALVILKLYFFDVWQLGRFYRISAFVVLGALLISTSFLYSRFRSFIESWWKDDHAQVNSQA